MPISRIKSKKEFKEEKVQNKEEKLKEKCSIKNVKSMLLLHVFN